MSTHLFLLTNDEKTDRIMVDLDAIVLMQIGPDKEVAGNCKVAMVLYGTEVPANISMGEKAAQALQDSWLHRGKQPKEEPAPTQPEQAS